MSGEEFIPCEDWKKKSPAELQAEIESKNQIIFALWVAVLAFGSALAWVLVVW